MKIVLLTSSLGAGGAERVATTLCNAWAARGDAVTLIATFSGGGSPFYEISDAVELIQLAEIVPVKSKTVLSYARRLYALRKLIADRAPDVIVSFLPNVNVAAVLSSAFLRIPLIICERRDPSSQPCSNIWEAACKLSYRFADMVTVQTEFAAKNILNLYPQLKKVRSVPNPVPNGVEETRKRAINQRKILLSLGRLSPEKQVDATLNAYAAVSQKFDDWDLHIYGDGPLFKTLHARIAELGLQNRAFLKGPTKSPWEVMAAADAFAMTSKCEGFPNALLEAMGIGLPCIVFDCPSGPREITCDGKYGLLLPLDDNAGLVLTLTKVMSNASFGCQLGAEARASVLSRFSLKTVIQKWDELFREVGALS